MEMVRRASAQGLPLERQMGDTQTAQNSLGCVLAAVDMGPSSRRVLLHAAGLARVLSTSLKVLHVGADASAEQRQHVLEFCALQGPYEIDLGDDDIVLRPGFVSEAAPILLVPPVDLDIVNLADRARLSSGPVLAAVDLADANTHQLQFAGELAQLAGQPLLLVTVAGRRLTDRLTSSMLRERAYRAAVMPRVTIVRHGDIAEQISRCAVAERTGLVVMGLRAKPHKHPGAIASALLRTNSAFVLAVPEATS